MIFFWCSHGLKKLVCCPHAVKAVAAAGLNQYLRASLLLLLLFLGTLILKLRCNLVCLIHWLVEVGEIKLTVGEAVCRIRLLEIDQVLRLGPNGFTENSFYCFIMVEQLAEQGLAAFAQMAKAPTLVLVDFEQLDLIFNWV